jgi:hypothetical protein
MKQYRFCRDPEDHNDYFLGTLSEYLQVCEELMYVDCCEVHSFSAKDREEAIQYIKDNIYKDFV